MHSRSDVAFAVVLALAVLVRSGAATAAHAGRTKLAPITDFIRIHGQPDSVDVVGKHNRAYQWRLATTLDFPGDQIVNHETFNCKVTALVSPSGRILRMMVEPANVGAAAIASAGTFGSMCKKRFGLTRDQPPAVILRR